MDQKEPETLKLKDFTHECLEIGGGHSLHTFTVEQLAGRTVDVCVHTTQRELDRGTEIGINMTMSVCNPEDSYRTGLGKEIAVGRSILSDSNDLVLQVREDKDLEEHTEIAIVTLIMEKLDKLEKELIHADSVSQAFKELKAVQDNANGKAIASLCRG